MNLFNRNQPVSEHDLYALHLKELSPRRARTVRRALATDPALAEESAAIALTLSLLRPTASELSAQLDSAVLERNWQALRPALRAHTPPAPSAPWRPMLAGAVLTAAAGAILFFRLHPAPMPAATPKVLTANSNDQPTPDPGTVLPGSQHEQSSSALPGIRPHNLPYGLTAHPQQASPAAPRSLTATPVHPLPLAVISSRVPEPLVPLTTKPVPSTPHPVLTVNPAPVTEAALSANAAPLCQPNQADGQIHAAGHSAAGTPGSKPRARRETDLALAMGGTFILPHSSVFATNQSRAESVSNAVLAIAAFHQQFRPKLGYRVTVSYTRPDFGYSAGTIGSTTQQADKINSQIFELAGTYVAHGPHRGRLTTTLDAGAALLAFVPTAPSTQTSYGYRAAGVLGINADYAVTRRVAVRAAYRAQVFKTPDFRYSGGFIPVTTYVTLSNEPSLGVVYRFGKQ